MKALIDDYSHEAEGLEHYIENLQKEIRSCYSETVKDKIRRRIALLEEELFEIRLDISAMMRGEEGRKND